MEYAKNLREIANRLGVADSNKSFEDVSLSMFSCMGMGKAERMKHTANPPNIRVRIYHLFECEASREAKQSYSQITRGVIAGILTELYKTKMTAKELKRIAKGEPYYEFEAKPEE